VKKVPAAALAAAPQATRRREPVTAEVRRQVWRRDEGRCAWVGPDGHRCGSRWRLEIDHLESAALGGPSTPENLRLACALCRSRHNAHYADCLLMPRRDPDALRPKGSRISDAA
jgi:5-methylcytosine-specific restriction endonuclease McrA